MMTSIQNFPVYLYLLDLYRHCEVILFSTLEGDEES